MEIDFGKFLKTMRMDRGLTQAKLAKMCGVTQSTIGVWENGVNVPSVENLYALAKAFDITPASLRKAQAGEIIDMAEVEPKALPLSNARAMKQYSEIASEEIRNTLADTELNFKWQERKKGRSGISWTPDLMTEHLLIELTVATNRTRLKASLFDLVAMQKDFGDDELSYLLIVMVPEDSQSAIVNKAEQKTLEKIASIACVSLQFVSSPQEAAELILAHCRLTGDLKETDFYDDYELE